MCDEMRYPPFYETEQARAFRQHYLQTQCALRIHGMEFHRHYAASVACAPSRTSIYTGQYLYETLSLVRLTCLVRNVPWAKA